MSGSMMRHCHQCGWEYVLPGLPGRTESCHQCGADLKVCLNCVSYEPRVAHQCRDRRADPVAEKQMANFCEYFDFVRRTWVPRTQVDAREEKARENLKKLFGD
jgi:ribosome-binding protein aMBF1 (putative translation factor)